MPRPEIILSDARAGRIEAVRLGVRIAREVAPTGVRSAVTDDHFAADGLSPGARSLAGIEIAIQRLDHGDAATFEWQVRNGTDRELQLESVVLGLRWSREEGEGEGAAGSLRFLRHGWQSWSFTGVRELDSGGEPDFPSGEWLRGMHHAAGAPPGDRRGWHESDIVTVVGASPVGAACLTGVLESGESFGSVYLRPDRFGARIEIELRLEIPLAPGEERRLEAIRVALGEDPNRLLENFAELWGRRAGARNAASFQTGWCSWYHFFHEVSEEDLLRNLAVLAEERDSLPVDVVQLDDGYQRAVGDWLDTNAKFPRGLEPLAREIRAAGFRPGIWTAPFCVVPESQLFAAHPEWLLRDGEEFFRGLLHPAWSSEGSVYALDTTQPPVIDHIGGVFRQLREMGFSYLKLDFLHSVAMRADALDRSVTRAQRLRRGLQAVRAGAGEDAFLLGCGCPLGPAVGVVDAMRIGPDVAPSWEPDGPVVVPGLESVLPSLQSALRSVLHRAWMHRRLWINDPDCLMARSRDTKLQPEEIRSLAAAIAATGGMAVFSDDAASLSEEDRARVRETIEVARGVDAAGGRGIARVLNLLDAEGPRVVLAQRGADALLALINMQENALDEPLDLSSLGLAEPVAKPEPLLGSEPTPVVEGNQVEIALAAHQSAIFRLRGVRRPLALFCDFDGTFSVQDVGATLVRQRAGDRRPALWARFERGELSAWEYNMELLDGMVVPEEELEAFLETIELDPGAPALLAWCQKRGVPLEILSDGFDTNLDRLQRIHGVRFDYAANHMHQEDGALRIAPGHPNPACRCGTGTCKRGRISAYRRQHPGAYCVHVGNGAVSDLCGAIEADLAFAKDTLAPALAARGVGFEPFETLHDVVAVLERLSDAAD